MIVLPALIPAAKLNSHGLFLHSLTRPNTSCFDPTYQSAVLGTRHLLLTDKILLIFGVFGVVDILENQLGVFDTLDLFHAGAGVDGHGCHI